MKRINKTQETQIKEGFKDLSEAIHNYNDEAASVQETIDALLKTLEEKRAAIEAAQETLQETLDEVCDAQEEYYDDRSDNWRDSEAGEQYHEWSSMWADLRDSLPEAPEATEIEIEQAEEVDTCILDETPVDPQEV